MDDREAAAIFGYISDNSEDEIDFESKKKAKYLLETLKPLPLLIDPRKHNIITITELDEEEIFSYADLSKQSFAEALKDKSQIAGNIKHVIKKRIMPKKIPLKLNAPEKKFRTNCDKKPSALEFTAVTHRNSKRKKQKKEHRLSKDVAVSMTNIFSVLTVDDDIETDIDNSTSDSEKLEDVEPIEHKQACHPDLRLNTVKIIDQPFRISNQNSANKKSGLTSRKMESAQDYGPAVEILDLSTHNSVSSHSFNLLSSKIWETSDMENDVLSVVFDNASNIRNWDLVKGDENQIDYYVPGENLGEGPVSESASIIYINFRGLLYACVVNLLSELLWSLF